MKIRLQCAVLDSSEIHGEIWSNRRDHTRGRLDFMKPIIVAEKKAQPGNYPFDLFIIACVQETFTRLGLSRAYLDDKMYFAGKKLTTPDWIEIDENGLYQEVSQEEYGMYERSRAAAALGKLGGSSRSEKKLAAVRVNGAKGGRPKKS